MVFGNGRLLISFFIFTCLIAVAFCRVNAAGFLHFEIASSSRRDCLRPSTIETGLRLLKTEGWIDVHMHCTSRMSMRESRTFASSFRTEIVVKKLLYPQIAMNDTICLLGSCFAENIGDKLKVMKFCADVNPFGISFNPISLCRSVKKMLAGVKFGQSDLRFDGEKWFCYDIHSSFSGRDPVVCLNNMNQRIDHGRNRLLQARALFITLGSAWAYKLKETDLV